MFIDILINSLFNVNSPKLNSEYRPKYVYLLAYASSVCETVKNGLRVQTKMNLDFVRDRIVEALLILQGKSIRACCYGNYRSKVSNGESPLHKAYKEGVIT